MAKRSVERVADIPFERRTPAALFDVRDARPRDADFFGCGWGEVACLTLRHTEGVGVSRTLDGALVLLVHAFDEQPGQGDEIDLGFWFDEDEWYEPEDSEDHDFVIVAPLTVFVREHLPRILTTLERTPPCVVLAVCNPKRVNWQPPAGFTGPPLWFPSGDVNCRWWCDESMEQGFRLHLEAARWRQLSRVPDPRACRPAE